MAPPDILDAQPELDGRLATPNQILGMTHVREELARFYQISNAGLDESVTNEQIEVMLRMQGEAVFGRYKELVDRIIRNGSANIESYRSHEPGVFGGDMVLFGAEVLTRTGVPRYCAPGALMSQATSPCTRSTARTRRCWARRR